MVSWRHSLLLNKIILVHIVTPQVYFVLDPRESRVGKEHYGPFSSMHPL